MISQPPTRDLDAMVERWVIRALVAPSRTNYCLRRFIGGLAVALAAFAIAITFHK